MLSALITPFLYDDAIQRWLEVFPPENIHIQFYETSLANRQKSFDMITDFLGLDRFEFVTPDFKSKDIQLGLPMAKDTYEVLKEFFQPFNEKLFSLIGKSEPAWSKPWEEVFPPGDPNL
jgi:hypothetical protein